MKIAALQLATLPMSINKLDYYMKICSKKDVAVLVLGEYVLNMFFKEMEKAPASMIKEQSNHKIEALKELSSKYQITIVAPIIKVKKDKFYKMIAKFSPKSTRYYEQQFLINYRHWNEEKFFSNKIKNEITAITFSHKNIKFAIINGFEIHFDVMWQEMMKKNVDVVLVPSVSAFDSQERWNEILKTRAFLNNMYILRVNRIGNYENKNSFWRFYGKSLFISPCGEIESMLGSEEELLVADIDKQELAEIKRNWGFRADLAKRGLI